MLKPNTGVRGAWSEEVSSFISQLKKSVRKLGEHIIHNVRCASLSHETKQYALNVTTYSGFKDSNHIHGIRVWHASIVNV